MGTILQGSTTSPQNGGCELFEVSLRDIIPGSCSGLALSALETAARKGTLKGTDLVVDTPQA